MSTLSCRRGRALDSRVKTPGSGQAPARTDGLNYKLGTVPASQPRTVPVDEGRAGSTEGPPAGPRLTSISQSRRMARIFGCRRGCRCSRCWSRRYICSLFNMILQTSSRLAQLQDTHSEDRQGSAGARRTVRAGGRRAGTHFSRGRGEALGGLAPGGLCAEMGYTSSLSSLSGVGIREHGFSQAALPAHGWEGKACW